MTILDRISPVPQEFQLLEGKELVLGTPGKANYKIRVMLPEIEHPDERLLSENAVKKLTEKLARKINVDPDCADGNVEIVLSMEAAPAHVKNEEQGYQIKAADDQVQLIGYGVPGMYYAVTTLLQVLKVENGKLALPPFKMTDYPDLKTRGHFMETRYGTNLMELQDWKHLVDHMEEMKQNHLTVSVYGCWSVQYDGKVSEYLYVSIPQYPKLQAPVYGKYYSPSKAEWINFKKLPPMVEKDFLGELIAYGKTKGVEVCPMVNSYGHNTLIPHMYPEVSAKDEHGNPTGTGFCTANPQTYEMLFAIYDEIIDRYLKPNGITSFDIGLDEVGDGIARDADDIYRNCSPWCRCPECAGKERSQLYIEHAIKLLNHLKSRGMKNIYMYHDMLIVKKGLQKSQEIGDNAEAMMQALRDNDLLKEVCIDWWTYTDYPENLMFQSTRPELGIRRTVKPWNGYYHWSVITNPLKNIYLLGEIAHKDQAEGMRSYSSWDESYDRNHRFQADYAWNFLGTGSIEDEKMRYVKLNFPHRYQEAKRAFDLFDLSSYTEHRSDIDDLPTTGRYDLLLNRMSYYPYSYVHADKPYPRMFPGEAIASVLEEESYMNDITQMSALSKEAADIFDSLSQDAGGNRRLAKRFKYEASNYYTLCDDYIALVEMDRLAGEFMENKTECLRDQIKNMAKLRKEARLSLMLLFEDTKEEFLKASHMRNHSIFMQYFADLEAYLANTPVDDVVLDFSDNTHFASANFWALR